MSECPHWLSARAADADDPWCRLADSYCSRDREEQEGCSLRLRHRAEGNEAKVACIPESVTVEAATDGTIIVYDGDTAVYGEGHTDSEALRDYIVSLREYAGILLADECAARAKVAEQDALIAVLEQAVRAVEWCGGSLAPDLCTDPECPYCGAAERGTHGSSCPIGTAIRALDERSRP